MSHHDHVDPEALVYGMVAEFSDQDAILAAAKKTREAGYSEIDCFTPIPVHGLDDAIGFKESKVQWTIFLAGAIGCISGLGLEWWVSAVEYPLNVGSRPDFSWPSFIPVAYECTILLASLAAVVGMLAFNGLPKPYHPVFNTPNFDLASQNRFFLAIEKKDAKYSKSDTKKFLESLGPVAVNEVSGDEEGSW